MENRKAPARWRVAGEIIRAVFLLASIGLAILFVFLTGRAFVTALNAPPPASNLEPRLGMDEVLVYAVAAACACVGAAASARLWLWGSWHVVSVAIGTALLMVGFVYAIAIGN